jgi:hypothetical protein
MDLILAFGVGHLSVQYSTVKCIAFWVSIRTCCGMVWHIDRDLLHRVNLRTVPNEALGRE